MYDLKIQTQTFRSFLSTRRKYKETIIDLVNVLIGNNHLLVEYLVVVVYVYIYLVNIYLCQILFLSCLNHIMN